jgi:hypothetical protein
VQFNSDSDCDKGKNADLECCAVAASRVPVDGGASTAEGERNAH